MQQGGAAARTEMSDRRCWLQPDTCLASEGHHPWLRGRHWLPTAPAGAHTAGLTNHTHRPLQLLHDTHRPLQLLHDTQRPLQLRIRLHDAAPNHPTALRPPPAAECARTMLVKCWCNAGAMLQGMFVAGVNNYSVAGLPVKRTLVTAALGTPRPHGPPCSAQYAFYSVHCKCASTARRVLCSPTDRWCWCSVGVPPTVHRQELMAHRPVTIDFVDRCATTLRPSAPPLRPSAPPPSALS